jgi:hypothetical protein
MATYLVKYTVDGSMTFHVELQAEDEQSAREQISKMAARSQFEVVVLSVTRKH